MADTRSLEFYNYLMTPGQRRELWHVNVRHSSTHAVSDTGWQLRPDRGEGVRVVRQVEIQIQVFVLLLEVLVQLVAARRVVVRRPDHVCHAADSVHSLRGNDLVAFCQLFQPLPLQLLHSLYLEHRFRANHGHCLIQHRATVNLQFDESRRRRDREEVTEGR